MMYASGLRNPAIEAIRKALGIESLPTTKLAILFDKGPIRVAVEGILTAEQAAAIANAGAQLTDKTPDALYAEATV